MGKALELLSPAGDTERLIMAVTYGADAVYLAGSRFGMRAAAGNFNHDQMKNAVEMCHSRGVRVYVTCNSVMHNAEARDIPAFMEQLGDTKADAVIVSDVGVMAMAKRYAPKLEIHISTQAGIANYETARAFYDMGASRAILARELTLDEIAEIRAKTPPELELEAFAHGAMCVSFSGRCLLSSYMAGRDANRGACAQPCRWKYRIVEEKRPGEYMEITEDGGTYIMNSRDMCMIEHLGEMTDAGVSSVKIEGRMKSAYYAAAVTNAYRHAIDAALAGEKPAKVWIDEMDKVSHRPYSTGFYFSAEGPGQHYGDAHYYTEYDVVAQVETCTEDGDAVLTQRNKFSVGETVELLSPDGEPVNFTVERMQNADGEDIESAPHPMMELKLKLPRCAPKYSFLRRKRA